jgi:hypothetical protein
MEMQSPLPVINCDSKIPATIEQSLVLTWAEKASIQTFTLDPNTLDVQLLKLQSCFTEQGWAEYYAALKKSGNLETIKVKKLTVSSQVDGPSRMIEVQNNQWKIILPLNAVYQKDKWKATDSYDIYLIVIRKTNGDLGIAQMTVMERLQKETPPPTCTTTTTPDDALRNLQTLEDDPSNQTQSPSATTTPAPDDELRNLQRLKDRISHQTLSPTETTTPAP